MALNLSPGCEEEHPSLALYMCYIMLCRYFGKEIPVRNKKQLNGRHGRKAPG